VSLGFLGRDGPGLRADAPVKDTGKGV
jgi:hypothetical protein